MEHHERNLVRGDNPLPSRRGLAEPRLLPKIASYNAIAVLETSHPKIEYVAVDPESRPRSKTDQTRSRRGQVIVSINNSERHSMAVRTGMWSGLSPIWSSGRSYDAMQIVGLGESCS